MHFQQSNYLLQNMATLIVICVIWLAFIIVQIVTIRYDMRRRRYLRSASWNNIISYNSLLFCYHCIFGT